MLNNDPETRTRETLPTQEQPKPPARIDGVIGMKAVLRPVLAGFGVFFIVIGVPIAFMTPFPFIPIGLPIVILGVVLLARNSLTGRRWMQGVLEKHPRLERFAPKWLLNMIHAPD